MTHNDQSPTSTMPVRVALAAAGKSGQDAKIHIEVSGETRDVVFCLVKLIDKVLTAAQCPTEIFCEALKAANKK